MGILSYNRSRTEEVYKNKLREENPEQFRVIDPTPPSYNYNPLIVKAARTEYDKETKQTRYFDKNNKELTSDSLAWDNKNWWEKTLATIDEIPFTVSKPTIDLAEAGAGLTMMVGANEFGARQINKLEELRRDIKPLTVQPSYGEEDNVFQNPELFLKPEFYGRSLINQMYNIPIMAMGGLPGIVALETGSEMSNRYQKAKEREERVGATDKAFALTIGAINGYLEKLGFNAIFGKLPGSKKLLSGAVMKSAQKIVPAFVQRLTRATAGVAEDSFFEYLQEFIPVVAAKVIFDEGETWSSVLKDANKQGLIASSESIGAGMVASAPRVVSSKLASAGEVKPDVIVTDKEKTPEDKSVPFNKELVVKNGEMTTAKVVNEVSDKLSVNTKEIIKSSLSEELTSKEIYAMKPEERLAVGLILNKAISEPNFKNKEAIQYNLDALRESGVKIPEVKIEKKKEEVKPEAVEKTPVEKPVLPSEKPATVKDVKKAVEEVKAKETPLQEGGKMGEASFINNKPIKVYRGEGKGIGNSTFVKGKYFADSKKFASTFGKVSEDNIPAGTKIFDFDKIKNNPNQKVIPQEMLVDPDRLTAFLKEKGYGATKNTNSRGVEYVMLNPKMTGLEELASNAGSFREFQQVANAQNVPNYAKEMFDLTQGKPVSYWSRGGSPLKDVYDKVKSFKKAEYKSQPQVKPLQEGKKEISKKKPVAKTKQKDVIKKATEANAKRLKKEGYVAPVKLIETGEKTIEKKTLKLKYPKTKETLKKIEGKEVQSGMSSIVVKLLGGNKITKVDFDKAGIKFPKLAILKMLKYSLEFKANPILVMKDGRLRFEGKTNKFSIVPEAMGLNSKLISEGTKIEVNEADLKSKEGGVIPIISKFINSIHEENVNTLLSEERIQGEIERVKRDLNPFLAKRVVFNIALELVDRVGGKELSSAGLFNKYTRNISISRSQKEGTMIESVAHEPGHQAWMYLSDAERNQAFLYYNSKTLEEKRAIFGKNSKGQWRYDLYEKDYTGDKDMLVEETLVTEAAKDYLERRAKGEKTYSSNRIIAFIQKFIEEISRIAKSIYQKAFGKEMSIKEIFQEVYDNRSDFFQGRDYRIDDLKTQNKYLSSILGEKPELKIESVPLEKIHIDTEVFDAMRDVENGEKSHSYLPILLGKNSDGTFSIRDGRHRMAEQMNDGKREFLATTDEKTYRQYAEEEYQIKESERDSLAQKVFVKEHTRAGIPVKSYSRIMRSILEESQPKKLTTDKGTLRTQEVFKESWRKLYGEEAPVQLVDLLKREADKEIVEKGYKVSFTEGKTVQRKISAEQRLALREKNAEKVKQIREELKTMYQEKTANAKEIKNKVIEYVKSNLPKKKWGEFLVRVRDAKTAKNLAKVIDLVDAKKSNYERSILVNSIDRLAKNIDKLPVDIQRSILEITSNVELKNHTDKLLRRLRKTKEYLDKQSNDFGMPRRVLNELGILKRTPLKDIKTENLVAINNKLSQYDIVGRNIIKDKLAREARTKAEKLETLERGSKNLDNIAPDRKLNPFEEEKITKWEKGVERLSQLQLNLMGVDRLFNRLDGRADYKGENYRTFKEPIDDRWNEWQYAEDKIKMAFYKMLNELKMTEKNAKRIAIYAYNQQRGGRTKLIEDHKMTPEQIDSVKLDEKEMAVYKWMRINLDSLHERLTKVMAEENNVILGKVEKYFPMMTNYSVTKKLLEEFVGENRFKSVPFGNIKERKEYAHQTLQMDAFQVFDSYVGKATYFMAMNKTIKELSDLASSEKYRAAVGDNAQRSVLTWLDVLARKGGAIAKESKWLDKVNDLNNKLSIVILGLRITTIAKQPLALLDGAAEIGAYAFKGTTLVIDPKWREFMNENSSELRNRAGGDPAFEELAHDKTLAKVQDKAMAPIKFLDRYTAGAVWAGAYTKKMDELGLPVDLTKPNKDALKYANLVVRKTQSSGNFKDLPLAMTGKYRTASKLIFKFQNFVLNRWSYISEDLPDHMKHNKALATQQIAFLSLSMMLEAGISSLYYGLVSGKGDDKEESKISLIFKSILSSTIQTVPFLGQLISSLSYGTNPVPLIAAVDKLRESLGMIGKGKKAETKVKHAIRVMSIALGLWKGIPTEQARQILEKIIFTKK